LNTAGLRDTDTHDLCRQVSLAGLGEVVCILELDCLLAVNAINQPELARLVSE
jgi:hypothetical protein